ncbi:MAG: DnaJ domain-containing protein [Alphaproteobacteria bacterium]|nr:DnaJ domain-containing protein [Alphaproteobacteria bacterium]
MGGEFRAPKSRQAVNDYYWFCLDHVRAYNRAWDFYQGMDYEEIEAEIRQDAVWHRPTWVMGDRPNTPPFAGAEATRAKAQAYRDFADWNAETLNGSYDLRGKTSPIGTKVLGPKEREAAQFFELTQPFNLQQVKQRYKTLVKLHHPDANGGDKQAEETLKTIIEAYRLLRPLCQPE